MCVCLYIYIYICSIYGSCVSGSAYTIKGNPCPTARLLVLAVFLMWSKHLQPGTRVVRNVCVYHICVCVGVGFVGLVDINIFHALKVPITNSC